MGVAVGGATATGSRWREASGASGWRAAVPIGGAVVGAGEATGSDNVDGAAGTITTGASAGAGAGSGALSAVVLQGEPSAPGERPWAAAFASLRLRGRIWRGLAAEAGVEGLAPLVRDRFHQGGAERATAFQQAPVAGVAFAGLGAQFP